MGKKLTFLKTLFFSFKGENKFFSQKSYSMKFFQRVKRRLEEVGVWVLKCLGAVFF